MAQAAKIGEHTVNAVGDVMRRCEHVQQGFNAALGILRFAKVYSPQRLEAACKRCLHYNSVSYRALKSVLASNMDQQPLDVTPASGCGQNEALTHENLRRDYGKSNQAQREGDTDEY